VEAFPALVAALHAERARFVLIGVWAANLHAHEEALRDLLKRED
jgi:hypothetical protein